MNFFSSLDTQSPVEQVIDVPKITQDRIQQRLVDRDLRRTKMAEQLVEVPTTLSLSLLQQQRAEQIVDNPVPRGRGGVAEVFKEFPQDRVQQRRLRIVDIPVPRGGLQGFRQFLALRARRFKFFFRTFPGVEKSSGSGSQCGALPAGYFSESSSWTPTAYELQESLAEENQGDVPWIDDSGDFWVSSSTVPGRWVLLFDNEEDIWWDEPGCWWRRRWGRAGRWKGGWRLASPGGRRGVLPGQVLQGLASRSPSTFFWAWTGFNSAPRRV